MKAVVIGAGRVGSSVAKRLAAEGWDVTAVDETEAALVRLGEDWSGGFVVGHGMDLDVLRRAGIEDADAVVVSTNGDNTNIVVAQVAQDLFKVPMVVVRLLDPYRAEFYGSRGLHTVCPTSTAIDVLTDALRSFAEQPGEALRTSG
jgi:trk system potassium uptake protein